MRAYTLTLSAAFAFSLCQSSFAVQLNNLPHEQVLATVEGLMYVHEMSLRCPFPKDVADTFELEAMSLAPSLPSISSAEQREAANRAKSRAAHDISSSRELACQTAKKLVVESANRLSKAK